MKYHNTLKEGLKECSKWLRARQRRKAKYTEARIIPAHMNGRRCRIDISNNGDELLAALFDFSLLNAVVVDMWHDYQSIYIVLKNGKETNIDLTVMETIFSWFPTM